MLIKFCTHITYIPTTSKLNGNNDIMITGKFFGPDSLFYFTLSTNTVNISSKSFIV